MKEKSLDILGGVVIYAAFAVAAVITHYIAVIVDKFTSMSENGVWVLYGVSDLILWLDAVGLLVFFVAYGYYGAVSTWQKVIKKLKED